MRGTLNLLLIFIGCTLGATSVQGQSEALPICKQSRTLDDTPCAYLPSEISVEFPAFSKLTVEATRGGDVVLAVIIGQTGIPEEVHVVKSRGKEFDEEAIAAFRQCRFKPTIYENESRAVRGTATLHLTCHTYRGLMAVEVGADEVWRTKNFEEIRTIFSTLAISADARTPVTLDAKSGGTPLAASLK